MSRPQIGTAHFFTLDHFDGSIISIHHQAPSGASKRRFDAAQVDAWLPNIGAFEYQMILAFREPTGFRTYDMAVRIQHAKRNICRFGQAKPKKGHFNKRVGGIGEKADTLVNRCRIGLYLCLIIKHRIWIMLKTGKCLSEKSKTRATFLLNIIFYAFGRKFLFYLKKALARRRNGVIFVKI